MTPVPTIGCVALTGLTGFTRSKPRAKALGIHAPTIKALEGRHRPQGVGPTGANRIARFGNIRISSKATESILKIELRMGI